MLYGRFFIFKKIPAEVARKIDKEREREAVPEEIKRGWNVEVMAKYDDEFIRKVKDLYETTDISLNQLAKREGIGKATVIKWSKDQNWIKKNITDRPPTDQTENRPTRSTDREKEKETGEDKKEKAVGKMKSKISKALDLTEKERLFCLYYIKDFNASLAIRKAGYNTTNSDVMGYQLLQKAHIKKYIDELRECMATDAMLDVNRLIEQYKKIAFYDISDFIDFGTETVYATVTDPVTLKTEFVLDEDGEKIKLYDRSFARFKNGVDGQLISEVALGKDGIKIKLPDRTKALDKLFDYVDIPRQVDRKRIEIEEKKAQGDIDEDVTALEIEVI